jgi:hypothetical protein
MVVCAIDRERIFPIKDHILTNFDRVCGDHGGRPGAVEGVGPTREFDGISNALFGASKEICLRRRRNGEHRGGEEAQTDIKEGALQGMPPSYCRGLRGRRLGVSYAAERGICL